MTNVECRMKNEEVVTCRLHSTFDIRHSSFNLSHGFVACAGISRKNELPSARFGRETRPSPAGSRHPLPREREWWRTWAPRQRPTGKRPLATANRHPATGNRHPATGHWQPATGHRQPATRSPVPFRRHHCPRQRRKSEAANKVLERKHLAHRSQVRDQTRKET
jgi:hypothetical protein